jgi:hypothetical protein
MVARTLFEAEDPERRRSGTSVPSGLRCVACSSLITNVEATHTQAGASEHVFANPAGIVYAIRLFSRAEHLKLVGEKTTEATWFSGYAWQIALCESCHLHLGWAFFGEDCFWALLRDRIIEG